MIELPLKVFPNLESNRLMLRRLKPSDANQIFSLRRDEEVNRYVKRDRPTTIGQAEDFISSINVGIERGQWLYWGISLKENVQSVVGTVCLWNLVPAHSTAEVGYELLPHFQGRGIMTEALIQVVGFGFRTLHTSRILAFTHQENEASSVLLEKLGFAAIGPNEKNAQEVVYELQRSDEPADNT